VISGVELLDDADTVNDWVSRGDDEFSGSSEETDVTDASTMTVAFHCYHSLPSAQWSDRVEVCCSPVSIVIVIIGWHYGIVHDHSLAFQELYCFETIKINYSTECT